MKYCIHCGKEIKDEAVVCPSCGCSVKETKEQDYNESKAGIGVLCAIFLTFIGLIIGLIIYPSGTNARRTFLKGWGITIGVQIAIGVILGIIYAVIISVAITGTSSSYYGYY